MSRIKVSKNLYRGMPIESMYEVEFLASVHESIAWLREDGTYLVRPAYFFALWGDDVLISRLDFLYHTTPYKSFWAWLKDIFKKKQLKVL